MSLRRRYSIALVVFTAMCARFGITQQTLPEKRVAQIGGQKATPVCQWAANEVAKGRPLPMGPDNKPLVTQDHPHPPPDFVLSDSLLDLRSLYEASDEVVLVVAGHSTGTVAPSGNSVITFHDAQVLRRWKGTYKVGDLLKYVTPWGIANCPAADVLTLPQMFAWERSASVEVLFLRRSKETETQTAPNLRLTGGYGEQGAILVLFQEPMSSIPGGCNQISIFKSTMAEEIQRCNEFLDKSADPVGFQSAHDPVAAQYDKMPVSDFLREIQSLAPYSRARN